MRRERFDRDGDINVDKNVHRRTIERMTTMLKSVKARINALPLLDHHVGKTDRETDRKREHANPLQMVFRFIHSLQAGPPNWALTGLSRGEILDFRE